MSKKIIQLNEGIIKDELKEMVRSSVEETLNGLLDQKAQQLTQATKYERTHERQGYRSGHYERNLTTTSGDVTLKMPKLKGVSFETAIIERYRWRESSVEEALIFGWGISATCGRYHRSTVGQQGIRIHHQRAQQESIRAYRRLAQPPIKGR